MSDGTQPSAAPGHRPSAQRFRPLPSRGVAAPAFTVVDHLNPRFLNFERKIDKETSVIFCAVGTEFSSFIHLL
jgi:hypothetical protein